MVAWNGVQWDSAAIGSLRLARGRCEPQGEQPLTGNARHRYKNSPIEEALVEFRFKPSQEWDLTVPGKLHEKLKTEYSGKPRHQKTVEASVGGQPHQQANVTFREALARIQFPTVDGTRLVAVGPDLLSISVLKPYEGWEAFRPRIEKALSAYQEVVGAQPVIRIGVRYINVIKVPSPTVEPSHYFHFSPQHSATVNAKMVNFVSRVELRYDDGIKLLLTQASNQSQSDRPEFIVDLDVVWDIQPIPVPEIMEVVERLHEREGSAFEALITDNSRSIFNAQ